MTAECACKKDPYAHYHHEGFTSAMTLEQARAHAKSYHLFHPDAWLEPPVYAAELEDEIRQLKARIVRLELKLHPVIEERACG